MANSRARTSAKRQAVGVDLDDAEFVAALRAAAHKWVLDSERDLIRAGLAVQSEARKLCPVDTGRLRASIVSVPSKDSRGPYVDVGTNVDYAPFVEYGTQHSPAQPFMRPALLLATRAYKAG